MGVDYYVNCLIGIELDLSFYKKKEIVKTFWCKHKDVERDLEEFCPHCGKKRPQKKTREFETWDLEIIPKKMLETMKDFFHDDEWPVSVYEIDLGCGDVSFHELQTRIFVGKVISCLSKWEEKVLSFSLREIEETIEEVNKVLIEKFDIDCSAELLFVPDWG